MEVPQQELPDAYEWFAEQVAGHHPSIIKNGKREIGVLKKSGSDKILKPKLEGLRGECEVNVYKMLTRTLRHRTSVELSDDRGDEMESYGWPDIQIEDVEGLAVLAPRFYGIISLAIDREEKRVRTSVWCHSAAAVKGFLIRSKPTENSHMATVVSMHCHDGTVIVKDKEWGKTHNENTILNGLREFFSGRGADSYLLSEALSKLDRVRQWFSTQRSFHFYSSSLLFVYENDLSRPSNLQLVMIDFSHVFPANDELDTNYIHGLDVFHSKMQAIHNEFASKQEPQCS